MTDELLLLGEMILKRKYELAKEVHSSRLSKVRLTEFQKQQLDKFEPYILEIRANFIGLFGEAIVNQLDPFNAESLVHKWGEENGKIFFDNGVSLNEALEDTSFYRKSIWNAIKEEVKDKDFSLDVVFEAISFIDPLLDKAVYYFSLAYVESYQESIQKAQSALLELTVPVVPLDSEIGILPLIGVIDTNRARYLMEETLKQAEKLKLQYLVLDLSGVLTVDTMVADQIFKVVNALSLLGVETIITGIRPDVAQTTVSLGINLDRVIIKKTPHHALEMINSIKTKNEQESSHTL
ncbi:STAS domain-containing protein [Pullulanibacillus sp. KACC 23026]|uniref:STAS domain-containing protein n=1 Tax=Pullulanibacillus sp. KACC 23026 TaxID=3028315 RepID=UPI0023AF86BA|nr:STAS domain-containing protein [Pullulanibacillus sp. KACC 23026]WEG12449.1 STAS domain-containing protein [Pullulanibacillus sp. KACC 23026]